MIVYRYLSDRELHNIQSGNLKDIGAYYRNEKVGYNSHNYREDEKYIHFFKDKNSMEHIKSLYSDYSGDFYFCTFDIPVVKLLLHSGMGCYDGHGYDTECDYEREFALPVSQFKSKWLKDYKKDENRKNKSSLIDEQELGD